MISVVPEEEGEDINMESYGEEDTEGEEAPMNTPQQTRLPG
jgi:hypothetical protein